MKSLTKRAGFVESDAVKQVASGEKQVAEGVIALAVVF